MERKLPHLKSRHPVEHEFDATFSGMRQYSRLPSKNLDTTKFIGGRGQIVNPPSITSSIAAPR